MEIEVIELVLFNSYATSELKKYAPILHDPGTDLNTLRQGIGGFIFGKFTELTIASRETEAIPLTQLPWLVEEVEARSNWSLRIVKCEVVTI